MNPETPFLFGSFRLDPSSGELTREGKPVPLTPKAFALLRYLVERPGRLLGKEDLLRAVWPGLYVGDAVLKVRVRELRRALGDDPARPRYLATVHRRGYRFLGPVERPGPEREAPPPAPDAVETAVAVIGRAPEMAILERCLEQALAGRRRTVLVTGEAGIGKTTLVEGFLAPLERQGLCLSRGQCLRLYGSGESYLPWLDALGRLARGTWGPRLLPVLRRWGRTWLAQIPWLVEGEEREAVVREAIGSTRERMLREMAEVIEAWTARQPLILLFEDLHWSDLSTLDLFGFLARRTERARLLLLATLRPAELEPDHPLASLHQELGALGRCVEIPVPLLDEERIAEILAARFAGSERFAGLAAQLHRRTEGNPLFLVNALDWLAARGALIRQGPSWTLAAGVRGLELGMPDSIRSMIAMQVERLAAPEQRVLEAAAVAGFEFSADAVAAALGVEAGEVEERCEALQRRQRFLRAKGICALTRTARYGFVHSLYQEALYERVPPSRRASWHLRIAEHCETRYGERAPELAAELATHFERGLEPARAVGHLLQAARNAAVRSAVQDVIALARRGLELLASVQQDETQASRELDLRLLLGTGLMATRGYGDPEVAHAFRRAGDLARRSEQGPALFLSLAGLWGFNLLRAELAAAQELSQQILALGERLGDPAVLMEAHFTCGVTRVNQGEFSRAHGHFEAALALETELAQRSLPGPPFGRDCGVGCRCFDAWALWSLGDRERAAARIREALSRSAELRHPQTSAFALFFAAFVHHLSQEAEPARRYAESLLGLSQAEGFAQWHAFAAILRGWAVAQQGALEEGIAEMRGGLEAYRATGAEISRPHFLALLAGGLVRAGSFEEAAALLAEAEETAERTGGRYYAAELARLKHELALQTTRG